MKHKAISHLPVLIVIAFVVLFLCLSGTALSATITGKITSNGTVLVEDGKEYLLSGDRVSELNENVGRRMELKGTVMEEGGKSTIKVEEYRMLLEPKQEIPSSGSKF